MFIKSKSPGVFLDSLKALHEGLQTSLPSASTQLVAGGKVSSLADLHNAIRAMMGPKNPGLSTYGIVPTRTPAPLTGAQITERTAKAKATRVARGTRGSRQKAAIVSSWRPRASRRCGFRRLEANLGHAHLRRSFP